MTITDTTRAPERDVWVIPPGHHVAWLNSERQLEQTDGWEAVFETSPGGLFIGHWDHDPTIDELKDALLVAEARTESPSLAQRGFTDEWYAARTGLAPR